MIPNLCCPCAADESEFTERSFPFLSKQKLEKTHHDEDDNVNGDVSNTMPTTSNSSSSQLVKRWEEGDHHGLLHGLLQIKIIRATGLRNLDGVRGIRALEFISGDKSDPFVTVYGWKVRFAKTKTIQNDLNPEWNEDFFIPVAHFIPGLYFKVEDMDLGNYNEVLGTHFMNLYEIKRYDDDGRPLRVGVHKTVILDDKPKHGKLEFFVQFIPADLITGNPEVPGAYFKQHSGNDVSLYVNADDDDSTTPQVTYGGPDDDEKIWKPRRLWRDIYDAICAAKHFIYITGWSVDTDIALLRGQERDVVMGSGGYSPYIGELLKQKSEEGVVVNMLIWDDQTSGDTFLMPGVMGTKDEETRRFFQGSKVTVKLAPMAGDETNVIKEKITKTVLFTHHQKLVILDAPSQSDPDKREPFAFVGGIDLTTGRWDNRKHPLFRTLCDDHKGDAYNGCFNVDPAGEGPREPWHDIHCAVRGPGVIDVLQNFRERWFKQAAEYVGEILNLYELGLESSEVSTSAESWRTQVLRSIDARTCVFDKVRLREYMQIPVDEISDVTFTHAVEDKKRGLFKKSSTSQARRFETLDTNSFRITSNLSMKKGRYIDESMHNGIVHQIRRAEHCVYIESQYFLSNCSMWPAHNEARCGNLIAAELMLKICKKIEKGERFAAYILLPMWPEGIPESGSVQAILYWQRLTMESMYNRIAAVLKDYGGPGQYPQDYLNFYCLATRETPSGSEARSCPAVGSIGDILSQSRRHQIYVHSKMVIVDDSVVVIGSANINQRSLDGARDSEIALCSYQPAHMATKTSIPHGDVHGFRMHCWANIIGKMEDVFRNPSSLECVHRINKIAEENWHKFNGDEVCEMESYLIPYPIEVKENGSVIARRDAKKGYFPDTQASVIGGKSFTIPDILTT